MKRLLGIIMIVVMILGLNSCDKAKTENDENEKINVVATNFPAYDFMREIGGEKIDLTMLISPGTETHTYEPSPKDIKAIESSDIFVYTGGESDVWVDGIIKSLDNTQINSVKMMELTNVVAEDPLPGIEEEHEEEHEEDHEDGESEYDEHVWTSPVNAKAIAEGLTDSLTKADPKNEEYYSANLESYKKQLDELDGKLREVVDSGVRNTIVVGDRFPFRYFVDEYNLKYYAAFPGCSAESEVNPTTLSFLIDTVKEEKIPVVFTIELSTGKVADTICEETGAKKVVLNACHNVTSEQFDSGVSYLSLMNENIDSLKEALK